MKSALQFCRSAPKNGNQRLKEIVLKACEADRTKRYQTASEMLADLQKLESAVPGTDPLISDARERSTGCETDDDKGTIGNQWDDIDEPNGYSMNVSKGQEISPKNNIDRDDDGTLGNQWDDEGSVPAVQNSDIGRKLSDDNDKTNTVEETVAEQTINKPTKPIDGQLHSTDENPPPAPIVKKSKIIRIIVAVSLVLVIAAIVIAVRLSNKFDYVVIDNGSARITDYWGYETNLVIPDTIDGHRVIEIGYHAFSSCSKLSSVTIPDSVTTIGDSAFSSCRNLSIVTIPGSVTTISDSAFLNCDSLTSVTIPDSVTTIGDSAFSCCHSLTSVNIPDSVTTIGSYAFLNCDSLTSVNIPDSVTAIGDETFFLCYFLTSVTIPDSVTHIGENAFKYCNNLTISGKAGSAAESYAKENDIPFSEI